MRRLIISGGRRRKQRVVIIMLIALSMQACVSLPKKKHLVHGEMSQCLVVSIKSMAELESFVDDNSLVLFDLDHTVFEGTHIYGHANWFYGQIVTGKAHGIAESDTIKRIFPTWLLSQERASVKPVEALTPDLIKRLQKRSVKVMGLTARQTPLIAATLRQLSEIDVDFSKSSLMPAIFGNGEFSAPVAYKNGIIFTSEFVKKSDVLKAYFDRIGYIPAHIIFVDDSKKHVDDIFGVFSKLGIRVIGLHYPFVQHRNTPWDQKLADSIFEQCNREKSIKNRICRTPL